MSSKFSLSAVGIAWFFNPSIFFIVVTFLALASTVPFNQDISGLRQLIISLILIFLKKLIDTFIIVQLKWSLCVKDGQTNRRVGGWRTDKNADRQRNRQKDGKTRFVKRYWPKTLSDQALNSVEKGEGIFQSFKTNRNKF